MLTVTAAHFDAPTIGWSDRGRVVAQPEPGSMDCMMEDTGNLWRWRFDGTGGWFAVAVSDDDGATWIPTELSGEDPIRCTCTLSIVDADDLD